MIKISHTKEAEVPEGKYCVNWAYRTYMPPEQNYHCEMLHTEYQRISAREAQSSGLGVSGGGITFHTCTLFNKGLRAENGKGVIKCEQCLRSSTV